MVSDAAKKAKALQEKYGRVTSKPPREYAEEILRMPKENRAEAIAKIPEGARPHVEHYVNDAEWRLDGMVRLVLSKPTKAARAAALERCPQAVREIVRRRCEDNWKQARAEREAIQGEG